MNVKDYIRTIPDFPKKGIMFRDITTVLQDKDGFKLAVDSMAELVKDIDFDVIAGIESRGFVFGAALAYKLGKPLVTVRKKGKLPYKTISEEYSLEYGTAEIEVHCDAIEKGQRVIVVDDLIATGGTVKAAARLVERLGGTVSAALFLLELPDLKGRETLKDYKVLSVTSFEGE